MQILGQLSEHTVWRRRLGPPGANTRVGDPPIARNPISGDDSGAGIASKLEAIIPAIGAGSLRDALRSPSMDARWHGIEHLLWNTLLPLQDSSGRFPGSPGEEAAAALQAVLSGCIAGSEAAGRPELRIFLPVCSIGEGQVGGARFRWRLDTDYPQASALSLSIYTETPLEFSVLIRVPPMAQAIQLTRNGSVCPLHWQDGFLRLGGTWEFGDTVQLRFGLPFRIFRASQDPLKDRPVERAYPGAPPIEGAEIYHGARALAPLLLPGSDSEASSVPTAIAMGVRKDGVLLLPPQEAAVGSPFELGGDSFRAMGPDPRILIARALWGSLPEQRRGTTPPSGSLVQFEPFETLFDQGA